MPTYEGETRYPGRAKKHETPKPAKKAAKKAADKDDDK